MALIWGLVGGKMLFGRDGLATLNMVPKFLGKRNHCRDHFSDEYVWSQATIIDITPLRSAHE